MTEKLELLDELDDSIIVIRDAIEGKGLEIGRDSAAAWCNALDRIRERLIGQLRQSTV
ncbi:hypothetical protein [Shewanella sp. KCT]|uniref:hypothetical protein n=1 Tax=Shewanella sp. KCT TaxID=2569535 RepID=UPI001642B724|nr:hypothetical protein [Shewanella sp. KCT]